MKASGLGWVVASGLIGLCVAMGFQAGAAKVGVVDVSSLFQDSDLTRRSTEELRTFGTARMDILQFVNTYRVLTPEQANRFKDLSLKVNLTAAERAELEKIKADAIAGDKEYKALQTKQGPTPADRTRLEEFGTRAQGMAAIGQRWAREFDAEVNGRREKIRDDVLVSIRASIRDVAKKQGYTIVFVKEVAPYAANDLTPEALKAVNAKK